MVKYFRVGLSFLLIFFLSAVGYAERLSVKETQSEGVKIVTVSNGFYVAEFTSKGGRLRSFIPNGGKDWVEWSPGKWEGGFFDDRDMRTVAVYGTKVYKRLSRVDIRFSYRDPLGIEWIKTFTIAKNSPVLKFSYKVLNLSGKEFVYEAMVRNMVVPGGSWSTKDYILFNDAEGIQNLRWTDFWTKEKESCKWVDYTVKPWQAVINRESGWALVFSFKEVGQLYFFRKGNLATMEFAFPKGLFKKGGALLFEGQMTLVKDFKTISYASSDLITGMSLNGSGIDLTVLPLLPASRQISVNTSLMDFRRNVVLSDIKTIIPPVMREGDISKVNIPLQIPGIERGPFIIAQSIYADNVKIAEYEMSWQGLFNLSTVGYRHPTAPISEEKRVTYKLTNEDVKRGYFVSQFQDEEERISTSAIEINIGREEKEWTRIGIESFKDIGDITCEIIETNFPGRIEEWTEENMQIRDSKVINNLSGGSNKAFWVRIDSSGVAPGEYNILLNISPVNADNIQIVMTVKVWDVLFPQSQSLEISWFHSGEESVIGLLFNGLERDKWLDIWEKSNRLLYDSGQTFFEFYPDSSKNDIAGQLITIPKKEGALPLLDFTRWDPYVEVARANGCKNVVFRYNWSAKTWLPNNLKDLESDSQEEVTLGILKQLYTYLKEQGFERVFYYLIDELDPSRVPEICRRMDRIKRACPGIEFAGSGFAGTTLESMQQLSPYLTWIAPYPVSDLIFEWVESGELKLLPNTVLATQFSTNAPEKTYSSARNEFWYVWKRGLSGLQLYGFATIFPNYRYAAVFKGEEGPISSPNMLGIMDGKNDYEYLHMLSQKREELKRKGEKKKVAIIDKELRGIIGEEKEALIAWKYISQWSFLYPVAEAKEKDLREAKKRILMLLCDLAK